MAHMQLFTERGVWYEVTSTSGEGTLVPGDLVGSNPEVEDFKDYIEGGDPAEFERKEGWAARYSAPGYLDCTEWCGVYATEEKARAACVEMHGEENEDESEES